MLSDYYIVKAFNPASVQNYLKWVTDTDTTEAAFLAKFWIKGNQAAELDSLLSPVLGKPAVLS